MSQEAADTLNRELVIIRRRAPAEGEAHHGGVWKIAYADFMTAMMAFFLVMWLINAANEETRSQVASYFNPVKLVDSRTSTKGLQDLDAGADGIITREPVVNRTKTDEAKASEEGEKKITEEMLLRDPFAALRQIAGPAEEDEKAEDKKEGSLPETANRPGKLGGKAYLDPFDPQTWQRVAAKEADAAKTPSETVKHEAAATGSREAEQSEKAVKAAQLPPARVEAQTPQKTDAAASHEKSDHPAEEKPAERAQSAKQEARQIEKEIKDELDVKAPGASPRVEVRETKDGVLISLTDDASFGMFAIASAEPQPVLVSYMEKIGKILNTRQGKIIIRGHTDGRPFRSEVYDNWRLSTARAHMAYYMLVRGGIDEKRVERIEGYADHDLKVPSDPEAAENRRIEILLQEAKS